MTWAGWRKTTMKGYPNPIAHVSGPTIKPETNKIK